MFELANTGVLLLDEVGDMPMALQAKLLRVLQERSLVRLGGSKTIDLDIRVIAATNKELLTQVRQGRFREDLYYRLSVVPIELKPLRERREDIPVLARHFCELYRRKYGKETELSPNAVAELAKYDWPGNIRELENLVERLVVTDSVGEIGGCQVASALNFSGTAEPEAGLRASLRYRRLAPLRASLKTQLQTFERELILGALERTGSLRKAAASLGVEHSTLVKNVRDWGLAPQNGDFLTTMVNFFRLKEYNILNFYNQHNLPKFSGLHVDKVQGLYREREGPGDYFHQALLSPPSCTAIIPCGSVDSGKSIRNI